MAGNAGKIEVTLSVDANKAVAALNNFATSVEKAAKRVKDSGDGMSKSLSGIKAPKAGKVVAATKKIDRGLKQATKSSRKLAVQNSHTTKSFLKFAVAAIGIQRIASALLRATNAGAEYSLRIAEIATLTDEVNFSTAQQRKIVEDVASAYGEDLLQTAPALYDAISAGATNAADATKVLDSAVKLSVGTVSTQAEAVSLLVGVLNAYGDEVGGAAEVTDDFFAIIRQGKLRLSELDPALGRVTPLAKSAGLSFKELGASIIALTRSGSSASEAITKIRSILNATIKKQRDFDKAFQKIGLRFDSSTIKARGFKETLELLREATGGSNEELGLLIGRVEGTTGVLSLIDDNSRLLTQALDGMADSVGSANQAFSELRSSSGRQFQEIKNNIVNAMTAAGDSISEFIVLTNNAISSGRSLSDVIRGLGDTSPSIDVLQSDVLDRAIVKVLGIERATAAVLEKSLLGSLGLGEALKLTREETIEVNELAGSISAVDDAIGGIDSSLAEFFISVAGSADEASAATLVLRDTSRGLFRNIITSPDKFDVRFQIPDIAVESGGADKLVSKIADLVKLTGGDTRKLRDAVAAGISDPVIAGFEDGSVLIIEGVDIVRDGMAFNALPRLKKLTEDAFNELRLSRELAKLDTGGDFGIVIPVDFEFSSVSSASGIADAVPKGFLSSGVDIGVDALLSDLADTVGPITEIETSFLNIKGTTLEISDATRKASRESAEFLSASDDVLASQLKQVILAKVANDDRIRALKLEKDRTGEGEEQLIRARGFSELLDSTSRALTETASIRKEIGILTGDDLDDKNKAAEIEEILLRLQKTSAVIGKDVAQKTAKFTAERELSARALAIQEDKQNALALQGIERRKALSLVAETEAQLAADKLIAKDRTRESVVRDILAATLDRIRADEGAASGVDLRAEEAAIARAVSAENALRVGIDARTAAIVQASSVQIQKLRAVTGVTDKAREAIERTIVAIQKQADLDVLREEFRDRKELNDVLNETLEIESELGDIRGFTAALKKAQSRNEIRDLELLIDQKILEESAESAIVVALQRQLEVKKLLKEESDRAADLDAGNAGLGASFFDALDRATQDVKSIGDLGTAVGDSFNSLTRSWISNLVAGGNAWDSFKENVLRGLLDIATQWAIMGIISTVGGKLNVLLNPKKGAENPGAEVADGADALNDANDGLSASALQMKSAASDMDSAGISTLGGGAIMLVAATLWTPVAAQLVTAGTLLIAAAALSSGFGAPGAARGGVFGGEFLGHTGLPANAFASGGIASTPQLAVFGEGDGAEAFVPLPDGKRIPVQADFSGLLETAKMLQSAVNRLNSAHRTTVGGAGVQQLQNSVSDNRTTNITVEVDARGANDPAAVDLAVTRGIAASMPQIERAIGSSMASGRSSALVSGVRKAAGRG